MPNKSSCLRCSLQGRARPKRENHTKLQHSEGRRDETTPGRVRPNRWRFGASCSCRQLVLVNLTTLLMVDYTHLSLRKHPGDFIRRRWTTSARASQTKQRDRYSVLLRRNEVPTQLLTMPRTQTCAGFAWLYYNPPRVSD